MDNETRMARKLARKEREKNGEEESFILLPKRSRDAEYWRQLFYSACALLGYTWGAVIAGVIILLLSKK